MQTALLTIVGALLLLVPGFLVALAVRVRWSVAAVAAIPVTFGMVVLGATVTSAAGIPWNPWSALATLVVFVVAASAYSVALSFFARRRSPRTDAEARTTDLEGRPAQLNEQHASSSAQHASPSVAGGSRWSDRLRSLVPADRELPWKALAAAAAGVLVGMGTIYSILMSGMRRAPDGIASLSNVWDELWHANVIRFISDTGIAGALDLGRLINVENHANFYYPDAWHALGALEIPLTGSGVLPVINIWTITGLAMVVPLSAAALAWRVARGRFSPTASALAAGSAGAVSGLLPSLPYVEVMTTANPNALSAGMAGIVAVLVMSVTGARRRIPLAVLALTGIAGVHPSGAVLTVLLLAVWWLFEALWQPRRGRLKDLGALAGVAVLTVLIMIPQIRSVLDEQTAIEAYDFSADSSRLTSLHDAFTLSNWVTDQFPTPWVLLGIAIAGCVVMLARASAWMTIMWALMLLVVCDAIRPFGGITTDLLSTFSNAFYADPRRLQYAVALVVVSLAGTAIGLTVWGIYRALRRWRRVPRPAAVGALVVLLLAVPVTSSASVSTYAEDLGDTAMADRAGRMISPADRGAFQYLANLPSARETTIFVDPDQGTGWMYALEGLHPLFTHFAFPEPMGERTWALWDRLNTAGANPRVDAALRELNIRYIVKSPPVYWPFQTVPRGLTDLDGAPGLERIYFNGETRIYEVTAWEPPQPGEKRYGWDPFADRSDAEPWHGPPEVLPPWAERD